VGKNTEAQRPNQRPISSYIRVHSAKKDEQEISVEKNINVSEIVLKFNKFVEKNNISFNEFCDNPDIFIDMTTFKELFKKIRYDMSTSEFNALFWFENRLAKEGYILMKNFHKTFSSSIKWKKVNLDNPNAEYDVRRLNKEFKDLHKEVLDIVSKEKGHQGRIMTARQKGSKGTGKKDFKPFQFENKQITEADQSQNSMTKSQREGLYPKIMTKESLNRSSKDNTIKAFLSHRLKAEELEDQRIKEDIQRVSHLYLTLRGIKSLSTIARKKSARLIIML
jgi:hypothetical protein